MTGAQSFVLLLGIILVTVAMIRWWGPELRTLI
jgi:hypothetical protein